MGLEHDVAWVLPELRAVAESRMVSRCTVKVAGDSVPDADGYDVPGWSTLYTDLPVRVAGSERGGSGSRRSTVGGVEVDLAVRVAHFPADTTGLVDGAVVEVTSGEFTGFLRIVEASWQDQATARRVPVVETSEPAGWSA